MAEPTLKDLLDAMSRLETRLESGQREIRADMATKTDLAKIEAKVDAHRAETAKGFADLDP